MFFLFINISYAETLITQISEKEYLINTTELGSNFSFSINETSYKIVSFIKTEPNNCAEQVARFFSCFSYNGTHCIQGCSNGHICSHNYTCVLPSNAEYNKLSNYIYKSKEPFTNLYWNITNKVFYGNAFGIPISFVLLIAILVLFRKKRRHL